MVLFYQGFGYAGVVLEIAVVFNKQIMAARLFCDFHQVRLAAFVGQANGVNGTFAAIVFSGQNRCSRIPPKPTRSVGATIKLSIRQQEAT